MLSQEEKVLLDNSCWTCGEPISPGFGTFCGEQCRNAESPDELLPDESIMMRTGSNVIEGHDGWRWAFDISRFQANNIDFIKCIKSNPETKFSTKLIAIKDMQHFMSQIDYVLSFTVKKE